MTKPCSPSRLFATLLWLALDLSADPKAPASHLRRKHSARLREAARLHRLAVLSEQSALSLPAELADESDVALAARVVDATSRAEPPDAPAAARRVLGLVSMRAELRDKQAAGRVRVAEAVAATAAGALALQTWSADQPAVP